MEDQVKFRSAKRRKVVQPQGTADEATDHDSTEPTQKQVRSLEITESDDVASILKLRKQARNRGGVLFSNTQAMARPQEETPENAVQVDVTAEKMQMISNRFVAHTGQIIDDDKHMMEYVDSEMARRRLTTTGSTFKSRGTDMSRVNLQSESESYSEDDLAADTGQSRTRDPAALGQLQEVDLDPSQDSKPSIEPKARRPRRQKIRLGRDGKPLKARPRRSRPSEDIARDALIEQILTEHRPEQHEGPERGRANTSQAGRNEDADERLATQFREEFLNSQAQRRQLQQQQRNKAPPGETGQRGPKLGGSRSQRAAMERAMREKEAKEKGGK